MSEDDVDRNYDAGELAFEHKHGIEIKMVDCKYCINGTWETECCNGANGCDCYGEPVKMGRCNVCGGTGWHRPDADTRANSRTIQGRCFLGSGPTRGYWAEWRSLR